MTLKNMIIGATTELTMAAVLLTGLYGASGQWLLDSFSVVDPITTGVAVGTSSHSIGIDSTVIAPIPRFQNKLKLNNLFHCLILHQFFDHMKCKFH